MIAALKTTQKSHEAALRYLISRNAVEKLCEPVPVLFGCPQHGETVRRRRRADDIQVPTMARRLLRQIS